MILLDRFGEKTELERLGTYPNLAIYPGSFNPLHEGHTGIYELLSERGFHVVFELSRTRFQKSPYPDDVFNRLIKQFQNFAELIISDAPLFSQKRDQLIQFQPYWIMGYDTAKRWIDENKKANALEQEKIDQMKVIFVGRLSQGVYYNPRDLLSGDEKYTLEVLHFRCDISSTEIREKMNP